MRITEDELEDKCRRLILDQMGEYLSQGGNETDAHWYYRLWEHLEMIRCKPIYYASRSVVDDLSQQLFELAQNMDRRGLADPRPQSERQ